MNEITALRLVKIEELKLEQNEILAKEAGVKKPGENKESPPQIWHVPSHNQFFTGRKQVIERLHDALRCNGSVQVIRGLGGMGKSKLTRGAGFRSCRSGAGYWHH